jgi:hypothetical protein
MTTPAEISAQAEPGHHALVLLDKAGCHTSPPVLAPANEAAAQIPRR